MNAPAQGACERQACRTFHLKYKNISNQELHQGRAASPSLTQQSVAEAAISLPCDDLPQKNNQARKRAEVGLPLQAEEQGWGVEASLLVKGCGASQFLRTSVPFNGTMTVPRLRSLHREPLRLKTQTVVSASKSIGQPCKKSYRLLNFHSLLVM